MKGHELKDILNEICAENNISQTEVARLSGIGRAYLSTLTNAGKDDEVGEIILLKIKRKFPTFFDKSNNIEQPEESSTNYVAKRRTIKNSKTESNSNTLMFYEIGAHAGTQNAAEILPVRKSEGALTISDLFKGSEFAIRISGNSMIPSYPPGAIIGIREIPDKMIQPGSVYVVEKDNDLWIKRLFYKNDTRESGVFELVSDNEMLYESGPRKGKAYYPSFEIEIDLVRRLFKVTGLYKANELTVIS